MGCNRQRRDQSSHARDAPAVLGLTAIIVTLCACSSATIRRLFLGGSWWACGRPMERDTAMLSFALEEAIAKLKNRARHGPDERRESERERADHRPRVCSLSVSMDGADRQSCRATSLNLPDETLTGIILRHQRPSLSQVIDECLSKWPLSSGERYAAAGEAQRGVTSGVTVSPLFVGSSALSGAIMSLRPDVTPVRQLSKNSCMKESLATVGELTAGIARVPEAAWRPSAATAAARSRNCRRPRGPMSGRPCRSCIASVGSSPTS